MSRRCAQAATEFIILIGVSLLFFMTFSIIAYYYSQDALYEERRQAILSLGFTLQEELMLISTLQEGVTIEKNLPYSIGRFNYEIITQEEQITISSANIQQTFRTPSIIGSFEKGENIITYDGMITISQ